MGSKKHRPWTLSTCLREIKNSYLEKCCQSCCDIFKKEGYLQLAIIDDIIDPNPDTGSEEEEKSTGSEEEEEESIGSGDDEFLEVKKISNQKVFDSVRNF